MRLLSVSLSVLLLVLLAENQRTNVSAQTDEVLCFTNPCQNNGSCYTPADSDIALCECTKGFVGPSCQYSADNHTLSDVVGFVFGGLRDLEVAYEDSVPWIKNHTYDVGKQLHNISSVDACKVIEKNIQSLYSKWEPWLKEHKLENVNIFRIVNNIPRTEVCTLLNDEVRNLTDWSDWWLTINAID